MLHILLEMLVYCCIAGGNLTAPCKKDVDICNEVLSVVAKELFFIIAWRKRLYVQGMGVFITVYFYQSFLLGLFYFCIFVCFSQEESQETLSGILDPVEWVRKVSSSLVNTLPVHGLKCFFKAFFFLLAPGCTWQNFMNFHSIFLILVALRV